MRRLQPATARDVQAIERATQLLREARDLCARAGAKRTANRVRLALTSAGGAARHVQRRAFRTEKETDYQAIAEAWEGDVWRPHFVVSSEADGYYWRDLAADDGWAGPFDTERQTWQFICNSYGLLP